MTALLIIGFIIVFCLILASGFPVGFGIGFFALGITSFYMGPDLGLSTCVETAYHALDSSVLVALPLFVFTAQLISESGMGKRLFNMARAFLGGFTSGLGVGTIISSGFFAAMTGSSFISASTMGLIAIPELKKAKYSDTLIAATITAGGSLGSVIPPSILLILYGFLTDESIGKLFMSGVVPGLLMIGFYSAGLVFLVGLDRRKQIRIAEKNGEVVDQTTETFTFKEKMNAVKDASWGILAPVIILGGIYIGIFTASEAAAVAAVYCMLIGFFIYKTLTLKSLFAVMLKSASISSMVAMIVVGGTMMGHVIVLGRIPQSIIEVIVSVDVHPILVLVLINAALFVLGMFMEVLALIYLSIPLVYPVLLHFGWDNIWFAVMLLINVNLALITPPMGGVLYVVSMIGGMPITTVIKGALFPVAVLILVLVLVFIFPGIATWLPGMM